VSQQLIDVLRGGDDIASLAAKANANFADLYGRLASVLTSTVPTGSAIALTTATPANVTSLANLPIGTYLVWGFIDVTLTGASLTALIASLSLTSATLATQAGGNGLGTEPIAQQLQNLTTVTGTETMDVGPTILTVANAGSVSTLYLVAQAAFSAGTVAAYGSLFAKQLK
jgi:hypothetical protein